MSSVQFIQEGHKYINDSGTQYTSTTTVIGKYKPKFDAEYWSLYKAIERFITETKGEKEWLGFKKKVGYKKVNSFFKDNAKDISKEIVESHRQDILKEWEYEKNIACFNGSNFHEARERGWLAKPVHFEGVKKKDWHKLGIQSMEGKNVNPRDLPDGVYSELILWNDRFKVAGAADIVYLQTVNNIRYCDIDDYKTNKEIKEKSYQNHRTKKYDSLQFPLNSIMDCNRSHYELQISTYAYYLECFGFTPRYLNFQHWLNVSKKKDGTMDKENPRYEFQKHYPLTYLKDEVVKMLKHHKEYK